MNEWPAFFMFQQLINRPQHSPSYQINMKGLFTQSTHKEFRKSQHQDTAQHNRKDAIIFIKILKQYF